MKSEPFESTIIALHEGSLLHIVDIEKLTDPLRKLIDDNLLSIHSKNTYDDIETVKQELKVKLGSQRDSRTATTYIGMVAEFFMHLYLTHQGFNQESLYINVEDTRGIKKGFDGFYSKDNEDWMAESKSGIKDSCHHHPDKVHEAFVDIEKKFSGKNLTRKGDPINPWQNALFHARLAESKPDILQRIRKFNSDFLAGIFYTTKDFNIIPCSTIFLDCVWSPSNSSAIEAEINKWIDDKDYKKLQVICITQATADIFWEYLN